MPAAPTAMPAIASVERPDELLELETVLSLLDPELWSPSEFPLASSRPPEELADSTAVMSGRVLVVVVGYALVVASGVVVVVYRLVDVG